MFALVSQAKHAKALRSPKGIWNILRFTLPCRLNGNALNAHAIETLHNKLRWLF